MIGRTVSFFLSLVTYSSYLQANREHKKNNEKNKWKKKRLSFTFIQNYFIFILSSFARISAHVITFPKAKAIVSNVGGYDGPVPSDKNITS